MEPNNPALSLTAVLHPSALDARRGVVRLHPDVLAALGAKPWDPLLLVGTRTTAALAAFAPPSSTRAEMFCDELILMNLGVTAGSPVSVRLAPVVAASSVTVAGAPEVVSVVDPATLRTALLGKVVTTGDHVSLLPQDLKLVEGVSGGDVLTASLTLKRIIGPDWTSVLLTVTSAQPESALVTMSTVVGWQGGAATESSATPIPVAASPVANGPLPGLETQSASLTEWLDLGFHKVDLLKQLGTTPSMGVLVTGPAGSGKSSLVAAVASAVGASISHLWAPSLAALEAQAAVDQLRKTVADASAQSPSIVVLEDAEALAPRDQPGSVTPALLELVRSTIAAGRVAIVCTTSHPEDLSPELRHPGLLDHELAIPLPDKAQRARLLAVATRSVPLAPDVDLDAVAGQTPGFVAADVFALVREAGLRAAARGAPSPSVTSQDITDALTVVRPTAMSESTLELSQITLDDVGDMAEVKQALTEACLWPLRYPDTFTRLGVEPPHGLLLYGPPGCGKTFLVKAIAGSGQANVLSVKGAEVLTKWVGESERAIRELFRRARDAAPALIFLDEIDALAPTRGQSTDGGATDRVVAALLTELDGIETLRNVMVIGATNRPDLVDPALLRPGRLERQVYVAPPDAAARAEILRACSKGMPLAADVDLTAIDTEGFSSADCAALMREAAMCAMRESLDTPAVTLAHVTQARASVTPSLKPEQVADLAAYAKERQPA